MKKIIAKLTPLVPTLVPRMEGGSMSAHHALLKRITKLGFLLMMGVSMNAEAGLFGLGGTSWKEEVLLHDGQKIIVKRTVELGGRHELFKDSPIKEQRLTWTMPSTNQTVKWEDHYSEDLGMANFMPMLVDVHQGTAYLVADTMGCLSYNKWGRPNPPYVIFKYQGKEWKRITLQELPAEIKTPNIIFSDPDGQVKKIGKSFITAEMIQEIYHGYSQPEFRTILRAALPNEARGCMEEIRTSDGWKSLDWFSSQKSFESCLKLCERERVTAQNCPCAKLFKGK